MSKYFAYITILWVGVSIVELYGSENSSINTKGTLSTEVERFLYQIAKPEYDMNSLESIQDAATCINNACKQLFPEKQDILRLDADKSSYSHEEKEYIKGSIQLLLAMNEFFEGQNRYSQGSDELKRIEKNTEYILKNARSSWEQKHKKEKERKKKAIEILTFLQHQKLSDTSGKKKCDTNKQQSSMNTVSKKRKRRKYNERPDSNNSSVNNRRVKRQCTQPFVAQNPLISNTNNVSAIMPEEIITINEQINPKSREDNALLERKVQEGTSIAGICGICGYLISGIGNLEEVYTNHMKQHQDSTN